MNRKLSFLALSVSLVLGLSAFGVQAQEAATPDAPAVTIETPAADVPGTPTQETQATETAEQPAAVVEEVSAAEPVAPATAAEEVPVAEPVAPVVEEPPLLNANSALRGTKWGLMRIRDGKRHVIARPNYPFNFTLDFSDENLVAMKVNCNNGNMGWKERESQAITFTPAAMTRASCRYFSGVDTTMLESLGKVNSYRLQRRLTRTWLYLDMADGGGVLEFRPVK